MYVHFPWISLTSLWVEFKNHPKLPLRLAGNDRYVIKQASGHKTDSAFQRYILVTEDEMSGMKWLEEKAEDSAPMDTYMDTCEQSKNENTRNSLKSWWASRDLNPGPDDYESSALTNWATGPNQSRYNIRQAGLKQDFSELLN